MEKSTAVILSYFEQINAIPRCSKDESRIRGWLQTWADTKGLDTRCDPAGNLVVRVPASPGCEKAPNVVIQGHMDMVCEKTPDSNHDFTKDAICAHMEGEWLTADRTTLGADNGIAIAYALALLEAPSLKHPPLELLFTVDEESGLNGVKEMAADFIEGKQLINLDSEDEGIFTIGCAGGVDTTITLDLHLEPLTAGTTLGRMVVGGLTGGHSGIDIHKQRPNANKLLARALAHIERHIPFRLVSLTGGTRHNAIARDANAVFAFQPSEGEAVRQLVLEMEQIIMQEYGDRESALYIKVENESSTAQKGLTANDSRRAIALLLALPHGVAGVSMAINGLVETSSNLATVAMENGRMTVLSSQRSAIPSRLAEMTAKVHAVAHLASAEVRDGNQYPPWQPDLSAPLLTRARTAYHDLYGHEPVVQVIHAGVECAIIGDLCPGTQMISFGPTIENPHSPAERLHVPSVGKVWRFLVALLASLVD